MSQLTPGPWKISHGNTIVTTDRSIAQVHGHSKAAYRPNAQLIVQAPVLYTLLKDAYSHLVTIQPQLAIEIDDVLSLIEEAS